MNSTRHFMRELNRLGITGVIDAGGGFQNYPDDYQIIEELHDEGQLTVRIAYNLFTQKPKEELGDFRNWAEQVEARPGRRHLPPQRRRRDAGLQRRGLRGLPGRASRHAAEHGRRSGAGGSAAGRKPLAVASARHLRRNDHARARRVREGQQRRPAQGPELVFRPLRDHRRSQHRPHRRSSAAASPCSTAWPIRANISSSATAPEPPNARRRSGACWPRECRSAPAPMRRASRPIIPGFRCPGSSPARRSAA